MDVLARLRSDMDDAGHEAYESGEDETDACLDILDEFIAAYEVASGIPAIEGDSVVLIDGAGVVYKIPSDTTILVPRERKPGLLEAAERMDRACGQVVIHSGRGDNIDEFHAAQRVLSEAIEKEKSNA